MKTFEPFQILRPIEYANNTFKVHINSVIWVIEINFEVK